MSGPLLSLLLLFALPLALSQDYYEYDYDYYDDHVWTCPALSGYADSLMGLYPPPPPPPVPCNLSCDPADWSTGERNVTLFDCGNDQCIDSFFVCDGGLAEMDCPNKEDEAAELCNSSYTCPYGELMYKCKAKRGSQARCIGVTFLCDGYADCERSDDEQNCEEQTAD